MLAAKGRPAVESFGYAEIPDGGLRRHFAIDLETGALEDAPCTLLEPPPNAADGPTVGSYPQVREGYEVWTAEAHKPPSAYWCIQRGSAVVAPWQSIRYKAAETPTLSIPGRKGRGTLTAEDLGEGKAAGT